MVLIIIWPFLIHVDCISLRLCNVWQDEHVRYFGVLGARLSKHLFPLDVLLGTTLGFLPYY